MADIFTTTAIITGSYLYVEVAARFAGTRERAFTEARPANLAQADTALAFHGFRRVRPWDLGADGVVEARVQMVDNQFNGTRAARLWEAVGTTHEEWATMAAEEAQNGDLISDLEVSEPYVVAGSNPAYGEDGPAVRIHMVGEGKTWEERFTTDFPARQLVKVARRKA